MYRIGILLLAMASLVASRVLVDRNRFGLQTQHGLGLNLGQGLDWDRQDILSRDELLRQKFVLDVLEQINLPLQNQELLQLEDGDIVNENLYMQPLDEDMLFVLNMIRKNQMLGKNSKCSLSNDVHLRQVVGLYRLLLNARDFQIFQRLVIYARRNLNTELFVNSLVLALAHRSDTKMLIIPALYEILPQLYHEQDLIAEVSSIADKNLISNIDEVSSKRPNLLDVITLGRHNRLINILNRSKLWMPWRELHQQLALRKALGGRTLLQDDRNLDKLVIPLPVSASQDKPLGLFTEDLGLKSYFNILIDELIVKQNRLGVAERDQLQISNTGRDRDESRLGERRYLNNRDEPITETRDRDVLGQRSEVWDNLPNSNRILILGRRLRNRIANTNSIGQRRVGLEDDIENINTEGRLEAGREMFVTETKDRQLNNEQTQQRGILRGGKDVSLNDKRVLFVGRRRKNLGGIENRNELETENIWEDDTISGGRRVSKDEQRDNKIGQDERKKKDNDSLNRRQNQQNDQDIEQDRLDLMRKQSYGRIGREDIVGENPGNRIYEQRQRNLNNRYDRNDNIERGLYNRNIYGKASSGKDQWFGGSNMGRGRGDQSNYMSQRDDILQRKSLDSELPTTNINDERLLHINRRRLNDEVQEGRRVRSGDEGDRMYVDRYGDGIRGGNRHGNHNDEGNRKYVDRDDDSIQWGNRHGNHNDEGNRKYVDRDDDSSRWGNRYGNNKEEGDRKYVDRDDDSIRRGQFDYRNNQEEGDRKYVDREGDNIRGGQVRNRLLGRVDDNMNTWQSQDRLSPRRENMNGQSIDDGKYFQRYRRSLVGQELNNDRSLNGKLLLHNLQQLSARINIERIALGLPPLVDDYLQQQGNKRLLINDISQRLSVNRLDNRQELLTLEKINDICQRIELALEQQIPRISALTHEDQINELGLLLAGQIKDLSLLNILSEIRNLDQQGQEVNLSNILENPVNQLLLSRIVKILDSYIKDLHNDRDILLKGVTINNVNVDKLQTFLEYADVDLTNLLRTSIDRSDLSNEKLIVGRIPRLNHKSFDINLDINSDRPQRVVIRNLLIPKIDGLDNNLPVDEQRQNYILLDIKAADLKLGRNIIQLKSKDISWTSRDTTPSSEIYERVMHALNGDLMLSKDQLIGQSNLLPQRLLIPRGHTHGLPMQLLTIITPVEQRSGLREQNLIGADSLLLDRLPLNYPLDGDIQDLNRLNSLPNIHLKDVRIYHDDQIKLSHQL